MIEWLEHRKHVGRTHAKSQYMTFLMHTPRFDLTLRSTSKSSGYSIRMWCNVDYLFSPARVDSFLQLLKQRPDSSLDKMISAIGKSSNYDISVHKLGCVLMLLPTVFKEPSATWFCVDKEPDVLTPPTISTCLLNRIHAIYHVNTSLNTSCWATEANVKCSKCKLAHSSQECHYETPQQQNRFYYRYILATFLGAFS